MNAVAIYFALWPPCELFKDLILQLAQLMVFLDNIKKTVLKIKLGNKTFFPHKILWFIVALSFKWLFWKNVTMQLYENPDVDLDR